MHTHERTQYTHARTHTFTAHHPLYTQANTVSHRLAIPRAGLRQKREGPTQHQPVCDTAIFVIFISCTVKFRRSHCHLTKWSNLKSSAANVDSINSANYDVLRPRPRRGSLRRSTRPPTRIILAFAPPAPFRRLRRLINSDPNALSTNRTVPGPVLAKVGSGHLFHWRGRVSRQC